jgi:hypothetical protein
MKKIIILLFSLLFLSLEVKAVDLNESLVQVKELEAKVEHLTTKVLKHWSPKSIIDVKAVTSTKTEKQTSVLSLYKNRKKNNQKKSEIVQVESIKIFVNGTEEKMPEAISDFIIKSVKNHYNLPIELAYAELPFKIISDIEKEERINKEQELKENGMSLEYLLFLSSKYKDQQMVFVSFVFLLTLFFAFVLVAMRLSSGAKQIFKGLVDSAGRISGAVSENTGLSTSADVAVSNRQQEATESSSNSTGEESPLTKQFFQEMSHESLASLLSEAYWNEYDDYLKYIWGYLASSQKESIKKELPLVVGHIASLVSIAQKAYSFHKNQFFFDDPVPIYHYSNEAIAELLKENKDYYFLLSPMRQIHLKLNPADKIKILQETQSQDFQVKLFDMQEQLREDFTLAIENLEDSPARELRYNFEVNFDTVEEEEFLLEYETPEVSVMKKVFSITWANLLEDDVLKKILDGFSARQLVDALVGPKAVIEKIEALINEEKLALVKSYQQKMKGNRRSDAFLSLHALVVNELEKSQINRDNVSEINREEDEEMAA